MRPGRRAERNAQPSLALQIGRKSVRTPDCENSVGDPFIAPAAELLGEGCAIDALAALVERHQDGLFGDRGRDRRRFFGYSGRSIACAAFRDLMNLEAAKAELAADIVEALAIALGEFPLRTLLQPAD